MPEYRRAREPGASYFFTVVTYERQRFLCEPDSINTLWSVIDKVRTAYPFHIDAWVLLPDHLHCIWTLPDNDSDYSKRWGLIKRGFTKKYYLTGRQKKNPIHISDSRKKRRESHYWQRQFWEHVIRDQNDFNRHCDYIHYNPVKHGLVDEPRQWPHSTFYQFVESEAYPEDWGSHISDIVRNMIRE